LARLTAFQFRVALLRKENFPGCPSLNPFDTIDMSLFFGQKVSSDAKEAELSNLNMKI
jgi:hypothetical protein